MYSCTEIDISVLECTFIVLDKETYEKTNNEIGIINYYYSLKVLFTKLLNSLQTM